jgi:hypothetical protein
MWSAFRYFPNNGPLPVLWRRSSYVSTACLPARHRSPFVKTRALAMLTFLFHAILFHASEYLYYIRYCIWHNYLGSNAGSMYKACVHRVYKQLMCNLYTTKQWCHCYKLYNFIFRVSVYLVLWCTFLTEFCKPHQRASGSWRVSKPTNTKAHSVATQSFGRSHIRTNTHACTHTHD